MYTVQLEMRSTTWPENYLRCRSAGWLTLYAEGTGPRKLHRLACEPGRVATLRVEEGCAWHVHWYPYLDDQNPQCTRVVNSRRGMLRVDDWLARLRETELTLHLPLLGHSPGDQVSLVCVVLRARVSHTAEADAPLLQRVHALHLSASASGDADQALQTYVKQCQPTERGLVPSVHIASHPAWIGATVSRNQRLIPMAALVHYAQSDWLVAADALRCWIHMAARRLGISDREATTLSLEERLELLSEVATTRLWTMVYQLDRSGTSEPTDDWWFPFESPDPSHAAYDCEDGVLEVMNVVSDLRRLAPVDAWTRCVVSTARSYAFCLAIASIRPGGKGAITWHAVAMGFPVEWLRVQLTRPTENTHRPPALAVVECTEYTTSSWSLGETSDETAQAYADAASRVRSAGVRGYAQAKAPLRAIHVSKQYVAVHTLLLPRDVARELSCAEVFLCTRDNPLAYGVPFEAFVADPASCAWTRGPVVSTACWSAFQCLHAQLAPRVHLHTHQGCRTHPAAPSSEPTILIRDVDVREKCIPRPAWTGDVCVCADPWQPTTHIALLQSQVDPR